MYQFTEDCLIGIEQIDEEHRRLFALINEAAALPQEARTPQTVEKILCHLADYAATHFAHEEAYMSEHDDPELPLQKKELGGKAKEIYHELSRHFMCTYDDAGSIGKRYRRQDEIGTPYCVTIDFDTLENGTVTVRDRDTMEQIRLPISELAAYVEEKIRLY